jgi:DMSO/TMAO reductase YedYZ molybdopterin-dependent catalytic subunit
MRRPSLSRSGYYAGVIAGLLASTVMIALGRIWNAPVPPQLLADRLTSLVPVSVFGALLGQFESSAKPLTFVLILLGQIALGGLVGALLAPIVARRGEVGNLFGATLAATFGALALVLAPLGGIGVFGWGATVGLATAVTSFFLVALTFAGALAIGLREDRARSGQSTVSRRTLLRFVAVGIPVVVGLGYLGRFFVALSEKSRVSDSPRTAEGLLPALTPVDDFYVVSKNFVDPNVALATWNLKIDGMVDAPRTYTYQDLTARPAVRHIATLECISNEVGGRYMSNGEWTGFPLKDLLAEVGVQPGVYDVVFHAADDYSDSIPLRAALDPDTFLVYEIGGVPLPAEHGYPLRLLVPNIYGMKNVKWITRISLQNSDYRGYWQQRGWSDVAIIQTMSRIDTPYSASKVIAGQATTVGGVAFAGSRGIARVEVSIDDGKTWRDAKLEPPLSPLSWVRWTYAWTPPAGRATLVVRAYDGTGAMQTADESDPLPDGATGYHRVSIRVGTS